MPPNKPSDPSYPHMHVFIVHEDDVSTIRIVWAQGTPLPRWGEGIRIAGHDLMVTHTHWSFEPEDGVDAKCLPVYRVYVCDSDDWDEDNWPMPVELSGRRPRQQGDLILDPDIGP